MRYFILAVLLLCAAPAFADSTTFTYDQLEDALIYSSNDYNYGGYTYLRISNNGTVYRRVLIRLTATWVYYVGDNQVIDSSILHMYCYERGSGTGISDTFNIYGVLKSPCWVEGNGTGLASDTDGVTWTDWNATGSEWGTAGCGSAADESAFNCGDGTGYDRQATASTRAMITGTSAAPGWLTGRIPAAYMQAAYDSATAPSVLLMGNVGSYSYFYSTENASYRPYIVVFHHTGETPPTPTGSRVMFH